MLDDLKHDVFPRFKKSPFYERYIQIKSLEKRYHYSISIKDFKTLRVLGRGAFGSVTQKIIFFFLSFSSVVCVFTVRVCALVLSLYLLHPVLF